MHLAPGMVLGRYELLVPIAQGGMATVWAARLKGSRGFQKTVAIKTMLPSLSDDPQFEQMFLDEASLASRIHHPNVAEILDLGEQDDVLYLVMEWVDGESLSVLMRTLQRNGAHLPQRIALRIARQACAGLHAAHELRDESDLALELVHRDVSPQNILVTYDGIVKLVDFGVAKAIGRAGAETSAGQLKGKAAYMSPEQAKGGRVDRRTDVFTLGIVLYKMTTGAHPFMGETEVETMKNIISRPAVPARAKRTPYPPDLEQVVMRTLHKDPERRFASMLELDRALERVMFSSGVSVADDEVAQFVRSVLAERAQKRRAGLRDAVRAADERLANPDAAPPSLPDAISDVMLTKLATGVRDEPGSVRGLVLRSALEHATDAQAGESMPAEELPFPPSARARRARRIVLAMLVMCGTASLGLGLVLLLGRSSGASGAAPLAAASPAPSAQAPSSPEAVASTRASDVRAVETAPPPPPEPASSAPAPTRKPAAVAPRTARGAARDAAAPSGTPKSTPWAPTIENPGF